MGGGGKTSTNTVQESELNKQQAAILKELAPYITNFSETQLKGLSAASPQLNQMLMQAMGNNTGASALNLAQSSNALRENASRMGVNPGDPRMVSSLAGAGEMSTKANLPEIQMIMSLFGTNPQALINTMGGGGPAGSISKMGGASTGQQVAGGLGGAAGGAYAGWQMSGGNPYGAVVGAIIGGLLGSS